MCCATRGWWRWIWARRTLALASIGSAPSRSWRSERGSTRSRRCGESSLLLQGERRGKGIPPVTQLANVRRTIDVSVDPTAAFEVFTEIGGRWRPGPYSFVDPTQAAGVRMEPGPGGRWWE